MDKRALIFIGLLTATFFFFNYWFSPPPAKTPPAPIVEKVEEKKTTSLPALQETDKETFYVLENGYQQLVFSNRGGALSEINLPFHSESAPDSVVKPIEIDRILAETSPQHDHFPARSYLKVVNNSLESFDKGNVGGYYPLLRRLENRASYYSTQILLEEKPPFYTLKRFEKNLIEFESIQTDRKITKTYSFPENSTLAPYCFDLSIRIEGDGRGLFLSTGVPEVELISGSASPTLKYRITRNGKAYVEKVDPPKNPIRVTSIRPDWICNSNGFFGIIIDPLSEINAGYRINPILGIDDPSRLSLIDPGYRLYPPEKYPGYEFLLPLSESKNALKFRVFAGPLEDDILKRIDATYSDPRTNYNPDYTSTQSFHGWFSFISEPFAKFLFFLMKIFYKVTSSWGFSIILLTLALKIMLYPLHGWSIRSTLKLQEISPKAAAIQEKYKKDPKRAQMEVMQLYRDNKVNPFSGCLPILIQMPFLIGMFDLLKSTFELRGASFIPGWIDNLASPDVLFSWKYPIPFIGTSFHLLPIILGVVMFFQQRFSSSAGKQTLTDQQRQQRAMGNIMTLVFTVLFYNFPSGLNLYWLFSMIFGMLQQWLMMQKLVKKKTA